MEHHCEHSAEIAIANSDGTSSCSQRSKSRLRRSRGIALSAILAWHVVSLASTLASTQAAFAGMSGLPRGIHAVFTKQAKQQQPGQRQRAVANSLPQRAPPGIDKQVVTPEDKPWVECLISHSHNAVPDKQHMEAWVFGKDDTQFFQKLLKIRNIDSQAISASMHCRPKSADSDSVCQECVRLMTGGFYGTLGVAVLAHPSQSEATGCLALTQAIDAPSEQWEDMTDGSWDGNTQRQTAFCNTLRASLGG
mmetsp:Transcript_74101/g.176516  ORF Transcript_74101/g.176516 Transcript_74101/m.176516 type:complete len:250 (-) Transcript_74101:90-839(-)|eukprot:CAMPEP_0178411498 /NCGR_PEP_ID=MMETSP0689_2-20121128/21524_1 /TAXON_ID=160604 /ORGANISM="Amphidinium massartii, Strain CS-259" /LENGTH=249 /DNA_ID=CAMNT_0020032703 /DNA_START=77 /DNA_END=826 /DNA_ORIENTATION=+